MSDTPGPRARSPSTRYGRAADGARLEDGVHVTDEQEARPAARQPTDDQVAQRPTVGRRATAGALDGGPQPAEMLGHYVRDPVHAVGRVRAAVDVDQALEVGEIGGKAPLRACLEVRQGGGGGHGAETILAAMPADRPPEPAVELLELRVLEGPNRFANRPAIKIEFQGDPEAVVRVTRDAGELVRHLHHELGFPAPRVTFRRSEDGTRAMAAFAWRRRVIAQSIAGAAARIALGAGTERRELRALRAVAEGPRSVLPVPRVPIVAITGTNGKSTTTRLIAHVASEAGMRVGMTNSDGIYVRGELVEAGDWSGFGGAGRILGEPDLDLAVLETARGGILLRGIGYEHNDVSVVTNVSADHIGLHGIDTLDELAEVKGAVVRITRREGWAVLNAEDPRVWAMRLHSRAHPYAFSLTPSAPAVKEALAAGGRAAVLERGGLVLRRPRGRRVRVVAVADLPVTFAGLSRYNAANALAAAAACDALGLTTDQIRDGLLSFAPDAVGQPRPAEPVLPPRGAGADRLRAQRGGAGRPARHVRPARRATTGPHPAGARDGG